MLNVFLIGFCSIWIKEKWAQNLRKDMYLPTLIGYEEDGSSTTDLRLEPYKKVQNGVFSIMAFILIPTEKKEGDLNLNPSLPSTIFRCLFPRVE